jgi:hypothetical protein
MDGPCIRILAVLQAASVGRKNRLPDVTNHSDVDVRAEQYIDDLPIVRAQILHLIDQDLVVDARQSVKQRSP